MFGKVIEKIAAMFKPKYSSISAREAKLILNQGTHLLLDVRSKGEFAQGKIKGAKNIPLGDLASRISEIEKYRDKPILVNCLSGARSASACNFLSSKGFTNVTNLSGGVMAWQSAGQKLS